MKIKTSELTGPALRWAVAIIQLKDKSIPTKQLPPWQLVENFHPDTDWARGGPIVEREKLGWFWDSGNEYWCASNPKATFCEDGPTPLIAAMRCLVASKLGDEVEVPDELA